MGVNRRVIAVLDRLIFLLVSPAIGELSPFTRDWEIKTKALSFHGRRGRGDRVRTVLKERYPGLVHTSWESCQPQMLSASELVSFVSGSPQRPVGVRWLL